MTKTHIGAGNVEIELNGEAVTLRPTLKAAQNISRAKGGIASAIEAVGRFDFDVMVTVIALGLGAEGKDARELPDKVFSTGMADLVAPVISYLTILANGGRPVQETGGEGEADPQGK